MNQNDKLIVEFVTIKDFPETKVVPKSDGNGDAYKFDILKGTRIPNRADAHKNSIKEMEFKFSANNNTPGIEKSALEVTKMIAQNHDRLKKGELYARVSIFMSARTNKQGIVDSYSPYINNVEFIEVDDTTKPLVDAAIGSATQPTF